MKSLELSCFFVWKKKGTDRITVKPGQDAIPNS